MTSAKKFLAVAIVAMFVASGFIVFAGNDSVASDDDKNVVFVDPSGQVMEGIYLTGPWALHNGMHTIYENMTFKGCSLKVIQDYTGQAVKIEKVGDGYVVNSEETTMAIPSSMKIDFGGFTYTVDEPPVGSTGTETQAFHIEDGYDLTLKNGKIKSIDDNAKMLVQNHSAKLTLDNMVLDGSNLKQGYVAGTEIYTDVYTLSNNAGTVTIKDSTIIECKLPLQNNKSAYAFDVCKTTNAVLLKGNNVIDGSIEFSQAGLSTVYIDGTTAMTSGKIVKATGASEPTITLEDDSELLFSNGVKINNLVVNYTFKFTNIIAGDGGIGVLYEDLNNAACLSLIGNMTTDSKGEVVIVHDSSQVPVTFGIGGVVGSGVTAQFNQDNAILIGALRIADGASWRIDGTVVGLTDESFIVVEEGAKYQGKTVTENVSYRVDTSGEVIEVFVVLFETTDHVESITYRGDSFFYTESAEGATINLSQINVDVESGYRLVGFMVGGERHSTNDTVTITTTGTVITAIVEAGEPEPEPSGSSDGMLPIIGAILVAFVALVFLIFVFYKKN